MYSGPDIGHRFPIGIKPAEADHKFVSSLSILGVSVRELCARLGVRFNLGKPMSRLSLYYHFRPDLTNHTRGQRRKTPVQDVKSAVQKLIDQADAKRPKARVFKARPCKKCGTIFTTKQCANCNRIGLARRRAAAKVQKEANG
jgi:hypothetical protein